MNKIFCTIITPDFLERALAVHFSLQKVKSNGHFYILTTERVGATFAGVTMISLEELCELDSGAVIVRSKYREKLNELRWSLKPILMRYLLKVNPEANILYCDADICFFDSPDYLFQCLEKGGIVLTPHWRPLHPTKSVEDFRYNFKDGLFNAGCIAVNKYGIDALNWWADACASACEVDYEAGLFFDQRYLDLMLIYFSEAIICRHPGFNVADWNIHLRESKDNGIFQVPEQWPIMMVHFTADTITNIQRGGDPILQPYYDEYKFLITQGASAVKTNGITIAG